MKVRVEEVSCGGLSAASLELLEGCTTAVIGPPGAGKSTLLQLLAGLIHPERGTVWFDDQDVTGVPAERRDVGVVFQSHALFPHLSVRGNIAFGLRTARRSFSLRLSSQPPRRRLDSRVWDAAALLGIEHLLDRKPSQLTDCQPLRVALARALAPRPALLLLDDPLSSLSTPLRRSVRFELAALLRRLGTTTLHGTRDREEAMLLADHLVVLEGGRVVQAGRPLDLYRRPATPFVASFLGEANLLQAAVRGSSLETPLGCFSFRRPGGAESGCIVVRPEDVEIGARGTPATVLDSRGLGSCDLVVLCLEDGTELVAHLPPETAPPIGTRVHASLRHRNPHFVHEKISGP